MNYEFIHTVTFNSELSQTWWQPSLVTVQHMMSFDITDVIGCAVLWQHRTNRA